MFCEAESEFQIAARTRDAGGAAFRHARKARPRISLICHPSRAQRFAASEGSHIPAAPQILIVTPRLEFPASATKQTLPAISNRYKLRFLHLDAACTSRFAAVASTLQARLPNLKHPWPPVGGRLIANLELESRVNPIRISELKFSNRKFLAISSFLSRTAYRESQAPVLIENARLKSELNGNECSHLQISNRERIGVSRSTALPNPARYQSRLRISKTPISNLQPVAFATHAPTSLRFALFPGAMLRAVRGGRANEAESWGIRLR